MNPGQEMYIREIARNTRENINAVRRELSNLEEIGLLVSRKSGKTKYYTVNTRTPIYNELSDIILKTEGVAKLLQEKFSKTGTIKIAFIYGSFANKQAGQHSDIDLFIVGTVDEKQLIIDLRNLEKKLSREINYVLFEPKEFKERIKKKDPFVSNVLQEPKIFVKGELYES